MKSNVVETNVPSKSPNELNVCKIESGKYNSVCSWCFHSCLGCTTTQGDEWSLTWLHTMSIFEHHGFTVSMLQSGATQISMNRFQLNWRYVSTLTLKFTL